MEVADVADVADSAYLIVCVVWLCVGIWSICVYVGIV